MLKLLDAKDKLYPVLSENGKMNLNIRISGDNEVEEGVPECAIVTANYEIEGAIGSAGVIGPMRMDYSKVISVLEYIGKTINSLENVEDEE